MAKEIAMKENILVGPSSGSVLAGMMDMAEKNSGKENVFVGIFADDGRKFKSLYKEQGIFTDEEFDKYLKNGNFISQLAYD